MRAKNIGITIGLLLIVSANINADIEDTLLFMEPVKTQVLKKLGSEELDSFVDYVLVRKKLRKLYLYSGDEIVKQYNIALGKQPKGQKQEEGDSRTPEGLYTLNWRNPNSKFFRSIHVSYPNIIQSRSAKEAGVNPGGAIMIHGQPSNWSERIKLTFSYFDWTEGCIALENQDMIEVWDLVRDGTPIKIDP